MLCPTFNGRFVPIAEVIDVTRSEYRMRKTDCRPTWSNSRLMRDEYGNGHRGQYAACRTAKYEFAKPRMPVTAHHDHARRTICDPRQNDIGHVDIGGRKGYNLDLDTVTGKVTADCDAANLPPIAGFLVGDDEQFDGAGLLQQRQCVVDGMRRSAAAVPAASKESDSRVALFRSTLSSTKVVGLRVTRRQRLRIDPAGDLVESFIGERLDGLVKSGFGFLGEADGVHLLSPEFMVDFGSCATCS